MVIESVFESIIEPVSDADIDAIVGIENLAHSHPWPHQQFEQRLNKASQFSWCVKHNGVVQAYCFISQVLDQAELLNIAVDPACQGQGIARRLMQHFMAELPRPLTEVFLEVRESNAAAIALYDSLGFNEIGRRENYYPAAGKRGREDALLMAHHFF